MEQFAAFLTSEYKMIPLLINHGGRIYDNFTFEKAMFMTYKISPSFQLPSPTCSSNCNVGKVVTTSKTISVRYNSNRKLKLLSGAAFNLEL